MPKGIDHAVNDVVFFSTHCQYQFLQYICIDNHVEDGHGSLVHIVYLVLQSARQELQSLWYFMMCQDGHNESADVEIRVPQQWTDNLNIERTFDSDKPQKRYLPCSCLRRIQQTE